MATINWTQTSQSHLLRSNTCVLQKKTENNGINWTWKSLTDASKSDTTKKDVYFAWQFGWDELKKQGIDGLEGNITVSYHLNRMPGQYFSGFPKTFAVKLTRSGQWIDLCIGSENSVAYMFTGGEGYFKCTFNMNLIKSCDESRIPKEMFAASDKTDAILVVEGRKMHVNKQFLSFHSDYFNKLFNSEFKEKSMDEIPIEDVKYDDFARLLSVIVPSSTLLNVDTYETLLELADRFMMPQVTRLLELILIHREDVRIREKIALADKYSMNGLMEKCLKSIETTADMKRIAETSDFEQLSEETKKTLFYKTLTLL